MKYPRVYHMLVCHGHSPLYAQKILIDAHRKDAWSIRWIRRARSAVPRQLWIGRKRDAKRTIDFIRGMTGISDLELERLTAKANQR